MAKVNITPLRSFPNTELIDENNELQDALDSANEAIATLQSKNELLLDVLHKVAGDLNRAIADYR